MSRAGSSMEPFASWEIEPGALLVRAAANEVYRARRRGDEVYLRITFDDHRARGEIEAEIAWMVRVRAAGVRAVEPLRSRGGAFVQEVGRDGRHGFAVCFARAPGRLLRKPEDFTPAIAAGWGALCGALHLQAAADAPGPGPRRPRWDEDRVLAVALEAREPETALAQERLRALVAWMRGLEPAPRRFGLTHADLHLGNLAIDDADGALTAFDFDDSCYHFFAHDLAVAVTSIRKAAWERPGAFDAAAIEAGFLDAYARVGPLDDEALTALERFVHHRIALSACWASRSLACGALDEEMRGWYVRSLPWWLARLGGG